MDNLQNLMKTLSFQRTDEDNRRIADKVQTVADILCKFVHGKRIFFDGIPFINHNHKALIFFDNIPCDMFILFGDTQLCIND